MISWRRKRSNIVSYSDRRHGVKEGGGEKKKRLRLLIAGGGIGGMVLALAAKHKGYEVKVFEKDMTVVRGEGRHRGPIQMSTNALTVLQAIDQDVARQIMEAGCVTGDRINGLADGISGKWFVKLDLSKGLPLTRLICRMTLQDILLTAVGDDIVYNKSKVVDFSQDPHKVTVILEDGRHYEGDVLVGADGIWSQVRKKLFGAEEANYSGYMCYSGLADYIPPNTNYIGYRTYLGLNRYFATSVIYNGKMQWYAFYKEPPVKSDPPIGTKRKLLETFSGWSSEVVTLISETNEELILRRGIYDRDSMKSWGIGRVTLLGDAVHPVQPNLGQGGCMAIEDCYQLVVELENFIQSGFDTSDSTQIALALKRYENKRKLRTSIVLEANRMASNLLDYYRPYVYFGGHRLPNIILDTFAFLMRLFMPSFMEWLLAGYKI